MTRLSKRHKLIAGALGLVSAAWLVDALTGGLEPRRAIATAAEQAPGDRSAGSGQSHAPAPVAAESVGSPLAAAELASVIESLSEYRARGAPLPFDRVARDLFVPTPAFDAALALAGGTTSTAGGAAAPEQRDQRFDARHELQGVICGRMPLAIIDGHLCPLGAEIDGYRLVEVRRDHAIFQGKDTRVTLRVANPGRPE
jgi:hypothetical protein